MQAMRTMISAIELAKRVSSLAEEIEGDDHGHPLTVIGVLHGSLMVVADLMRALTKPHQLGFVRASSYRGAATTNGVLRMNLEWLPELRGRDVVIVDDIFDTGHTLSAVVEAIQAREPVRVRSAVLLLKKGCQQVEYRPDYVGFAIPNEFVVGYGLDHNGDYRHLPVVAVLEPEDFLRNTEAGR